MNEQTSLRDYLIALTLGGMFFICIMHFAIDIAGNYDVSTESISTNGLDLNAFESQLNNSYENSNDWMNNTEKDVGIFDSGEILFKSFFGTILSIKANISAFFNLIFVGAYKILGIPWQIYYGFITLFVTCIIFAIWRVLRQGE